MRVTKNCLVMEAEVSFEPLVGFSLLVDVIKR